MSINTQSASAPSTVTMAMGNMSTMGAKAATTTPQQRPPGRPTGNVSGLNPIGCVVKCDVIKQNESELAYIDF